ncbi:tRNA uridine(34) 5-carboxymethylaminomethyl modification radical SAM/GNAT enzyme Elp3 [Candidatus Woesearchaeota archaeon]|nr:tRNA uridine(34) 5-carboxymethylaminomethyl modification radical SAM/GNAT enzyme Elp3 [Candidatus Woesearchaeota archaeon]
MNDFSRLFYDEKGLDKEKFNLFFEMPANIEDNKRTERMHKKLLFIKNLDLGNGKTLESINDLFFNNSKEKNNANNNLIAIKNSPDNNYNKKITNVKNVADKNTGNKNNLNGKIKNSKNIGIKNYSSNELTEQWNNFNANNELISVENYGNIENANMRSMKIVRDKANLLGKKEITLENMQKQNETAKIRCIGLTIETKSDYGKLLHGNQMLKLGCTRAEIGVQSIYDEVLEKTNRGNTVQDNIDSIRILKDLGFKINAHYMPGMPYTSKEMDRKGLKQLFENPDYKPDMLKIYPTMVMPGTKLYDDYKAGKFKPLTTKEAAEFIAEMFSYAPEWIRVMRVQRDIPTYATSAGVDRTNLRQYVEKIMGQKGIKPRDIRAREAGLNSITNKKISLNNLKIKIIEYEASKGKEFFIAAEDEKNDILFGYCRLRFPSQFLREEITKDSALIRELHVYSAAVEIGKQSDESFQHKGIGKKLLSNAEEIAKQNGINKIIILSGIGARQYFAKLGYKKDGPYMVKNSY